MNRINHFNKIFQSKCLEISQLKVQVNDFFISILELCVCSKKLDLQGIIKYTEVNWENERVQEEWFFCTKEFLRNSIKVEPQRMQGLTRLINQEEEEFVSIFKKFLARTLYLITDYLPLNHKTIDTLDLVQDFCNFGYMDEKVSILNNYFGIIGQEKAAELRAEVRKLASRKRSKYEDGKSNNILQVWDNIERDKTDGFVFHLLPQIVRAAQALPTTSSDVEQGFSMIKLVKTLIRNQLKEESLEAIMLIIQEYSNRRILLPADLIQSFIDFKMSFNEKKNPGRIRKREEIEEVVENGNGIQEILTTKQNLHKEELQEGEFCFEMNFWSHVQGAMSQNQENMSFVSNEKILHDLKKIKLSQDYL